MRTAPTPITGRKINRRQALFGAGAVAVLPARLWAKSADYLLDPHETKVGFGFRLNGIWQTGRMPIAASSVDLDPSQLQATKVAVSLNARAARTGLIFATQAMKSPDVLDVERYPTIAFTSRRIRLGPDRRLSGGAEIIGDLTLRGITRPVALQAALYRPAGTDPDDLSRLDFTLTGQISRRAFGATGFAALVQDKIRLNIQASLKRQT